MSVYVLKKFLFQNLPLSKLVYVMNIIDWASALPYPCYLFIILSVINVIHVCNAYTTLIICPLQFSERQPVSYNDQSKYNMVDCYKRMERILTEFLLLYFSLIVGTGISVYVNHAKLRSLNQPVLRNKRKGIALGNNGRL